MTDLPAPLARCAVCQRIMNRRHLRGTSCRDKWDCCNARQIAWRLEREAGDARLEDTHEGRGE